MFEKAIAILTENPVLPDSWGGNQSLFLLSNLIHLSYLDRHVCFLLLIFIFEDISNTPFVLNQYIYGGRRNF